MRLARKLFLLAAMAVTALALTAGSASAESADLESTGAPCGPVTFNPNNPHDAIGGCHVTFQSSHDGIPFHAVLPPPTGKVTLFNCEVHLEGRIDSNAEGWFDEITLLTTETGESATPCTRTECDEAAPPAPNPHADIPWPFHVIEHSPTDEEVEMVFCLRPSNTAEGSTGSECEIHLEFRDLSGHNYEVGHETGPDREAFCENNPPANPNDDHPDLPLTVSIEGHLTSVGTEEDGTVEISHQQ